MAPSAQTLKKLHPGREGRFRHLNVVQLEVAGFPGLVTRPKKLEIKLVPQRDTQTKIRNYTINGCPFPDRRKSAKS